MSAPKIRDVVERFLNPGSDEARLVMDKMVESLEAREDAICDFLRLAGIQLGMYPQLVTKVLMDAGLGSPVTDVQREYINAQFEATIQEIIEMLDQPGRQVMIAATVAVVGVAREALHLYDLRPHGVPAVEDVDLRRSIANPPAERVLRLEAGKKSKFWGRIARLTTGLLVIGGLLAASNFRLLFVGDALLSYLNAAILFHEPMDVKKEQTLTLRYRVVLHDGLWDVARLQSAYNDYVNGLAAEHTHG